MSMFGAFANNSDPASQNNFNPSWMGQTFNATSGVPRSAGGRPSGEGEEDRPMAPPIFMNNRYGREDVLALYDGGSVQPPDGLRRCSLFTPEPQPPCVIKPLTDIEKKLRENINSSKAMSMLSASERHQITSGGHATESPQQQQTLNRNNSNGWTHVPPRDNHSKTWGRTPTGTPPVRNPVRGAFTGGRGGGTAGSSPADGTAPLQTSPYGAAPLNSASPNAQNGERALGTGGTFPSRRGVNPVARGGGVGASSFNSRAQGLYNPHDPSDRPRQRGRSTSEDGEGGPTATPTTPGVGGTVNGGQGGGGAWQQPQSRPAWGRQSEAMPGMPPRFPEWAQDDDTGAPGGARDHPSEVTSGTFDEQGRFVRTASGRTQPQTMQQTQPVQHDPHHAQSIHASAAWGTMESQVPASTTAPMDISSQASYSLAQSQQPQQTVDLSGGLSGMSPSSTFMYALQQKQLQAQQQAAQYAAMQAAQAAVPASPPKPVTFFYLDPNGVERGPFEQNQMEAWFHMGYFQDNLQVRRDSDKSFIELGELQRRNGKDDPFKYIEPVVAPAPLPTPNMLAGYMDHQLGLGGAAGWDQGVQSMFRGAQATSSFEALMEKQRRDQQERAIAEEREKLARLQEMYRVQQETEREQAARLLREKEEGLQKMQEDMLRQQREMEERLREHEREKMEIERKKAELEKQSNREKEEQKRKEDAERRKIEEAAEKRRAEQEKLAAAEEAEREKERAKVRAEEMKRQAEEDKKRREEERKRADAFARAEELRQEAEREAAVERERQAQIAAARKAAAPPPVAVATPPASGNTTPAVVKSSGPAWGGAGISAAQTTKKAKDNRTLAEVMAEEERQARAEQRETERLKREAEAAAPKAVSSKGGVWGGSTPATIAAQAAPVSSGSAAWGGAGLAKNGPSKSSPWAGPSLAEANKPKAAAKPAAAPAKAKVPEKKKDEKKASGVSAEASFTSWFINRAKQMNDTVDGAVLASFIQDIANPDEVEDYMVGYLGEGKQVKEFVREYIHKRSELRNKMKAPGGGGATASTSKSDNDGFSAVAPKKGAAAGKKKAKFVVDSACLGFRATGDPNRVNQGEIDHPEPAAGRR